MIKASMRKVPIIATLLMLLGVAILCALGTWQVQRLAWKQQILTDLTQAYQAGADGAALPLEALRSARSPAFAYGTIEGVLHFDKALLLSPRVLDKKIGSSLIVPLILPEGQGSVLINLGWTDQTVQALSLPQGMPVPVRITGLARKPYWNSFTPENNPQEEAWYRPDIAQIAAVKGLQDPLPYIVYADQVEGWALAGFPRNERWQPVNNHAGYAAFWFSMAGVLLVIYMLRFFVFTAEKGREHE